MNVTSNATVGYSVATSSSESLLNDCKKPNQPKKLLFPICDLIWLNFREACIHLAALSVHSAEVVFINLYWKDSFSGKTVGFCKHKSSSLYSQAVEMICSSLQSSY